MELPQPKQRVRYQKVANFVTAIVEDIFAPVGMLASFRIEMFVKRRAVKPRQRKRIFRKMCRDPIHNHTESALMQMIDQKAKIVGRAIARGWSKISADLITPRWAV